MYLIACHPGGGYVMGGEDMQELYVHGKARRWGAALARPGTPLTLRVRRQLPVSAAVDKVHVMCGLDDVNST